ncbi:MAG: transcriptional initiation protein Tat [Planctomycetes bacterium RBG_13_60_9]|nr:MAG: transcriptional initiation protein Tat [Planctomycetes bacterium RBG_13_60_9]
MCALWSSAPQWAVASDTRLPDGTEFPFWEQPLQFSKTYYVDCGSPRCDDNGPGTIDQPFRTISEAAEVLQPGERVVIASGIYRECIRPAHGGTGPDQMISYEAAPGATVIVKGSETLNEGWRPSTGYSLRDGGSRQMHIRQHDLTGSMFPDAYNPFGMVNVLGDRAWLDTRTVDMGPYFRRRGLIFVNGKPLEPVELFRELGDTPLQPTTRPAARNGLPARTRPGPIMPEIGGSPDARFWVEHQGTVIHMRVPADSPANPLIEISTREQAFAPLQKGLGYIRIKGITFQHAANAFPPPQRGLVSTNCGNHWIIEGNTIEWANAVGLDIGNGDWNTGAAPQSGTAHIIRGNTIRYCGVEGIGGMGTRDTLVEDNLIEWVGWQDAERAWEAAGAKFHNARNLLFRRNVVRHIRHANAVWLDSGNTNCRITGNVLADVLTVSATIHMEMNRNYNQIDNNVIWNVRNAEPGTPGQRGAAGSGVFVHASDRLIIAQNLIGRCDNAGVFPVLREDRRGSGTGRENKIYNNIFASCGKAAIVFLNEDNEADGNVYVSMPGGFLGFVTPESQQWLDLPTWRESYGWDKNGATGSMSLDFDPDKLELTVGGQPLPSVAVFNQIDTDMFGKPTGDKRVPGPFADPGASPTRLVDPRAAAPAEATPARE